MKIRNKKTGKVFEVMEGTRYPSFFEEVKDEEIIVGEPKIEYVIEQTQAGQEKEEKVEKPAKKAKKVAKKKTAKKGKKNDK